MCDAAVFCHMPSMSTYNKSHIGNEIGCKTLDYISSFANLESGAKSSYDSDDCSNLNSQSKPRYDPVKSVTTPQPQETIIDGFAILSFRTKEDLTLYTQHTNADRLKASSTHVSDDKATRSRRTCGTTKRRTKAHYNRALEDSRGGMLTTVDGVEPSGRDALDSGSQIPNRSLTNGLCIDDVQSDRSLDACIKFPMPDSDSENHGRSAQLDANSTNQLTPFRISKYRHSTSPGADRDATFEPIAHDEQYGSRPSSRLSVGTVGSGRSHCTEDSKQSRPLSYTDAVLATTLDCHLAPLSTTWSDHISNSNAHAAPWHLPNVSRVEGVDFHVHPDCNSSMLSVQPVSSASTPAASSHSRPKPCHRFSVAALTDETDIKSQESVGDEFNSEENSVKYPPHFGDKRLNSKRPKQRHSGSRRNHSDAGDVHNSSPQLRGCDPSSLHGAGDPVISTAFFRSSMQLRPSTVSDSMAPGMHGSLSPAVGIHKSNGCCQSSCSSSGTDQPFPFATSTTTHSLETNHQWHGSRDLDQLVGMGAGTAERLFNNVRFDEVYSLTMAALAGAEAKTRKRSALLSGSSDKVNGAEELKHKSPSRTSAPGTSVSTVLATDSTRISCPTVGSPPPMRLPPPVPSISTTVTNCTSAVNALANSSAVTVQRDPAMTDSQDPSTHSLLHAAYNIRKFANRLPGSLPVPCKQGNQLGYQSPFPTLPTPQPNFPINLPPPPSLTAGGPFPEAPGHDTSQFAGNIRDGSRQPPSAPSIHVANQRTNQSPHFGLSSHVAAATSGNSTFHPPCPPPLLPASTYLPFQELFGSSFQKQWASLFKRQISGPRASDQTELNGAAEGLFPKSSQPPAPSIPSDVSRLFLPPPVPSPRSFPTGCQLPVTRGLPFALGSQQVYASSSMPSTLTSDKAKASLSMPSHSSMLSRPTHPGHTCGHWADAHVRIAHYIRHHQSQTGPWPSRGVDPVAAGLPLRPAAHSSQSNLLHPVLRSTRLPAPDSNPTATSLPPLSTPSVLPRFNGSIGNQGVPSFLQPSPLPVDRTGQKNAFLSYLLEGLLSGSPRMMLPNGQIPSKDSFDSLWQSALQNVHNQTAYPASSSSSSSPALAVRPQYLGDPSLSGCRAKWSFPTPNPRGTLSASVYSDPPQPSPSGSFGGFPPLGLSHPPNLDTKRRRTELPPVFQCPSTHVDVNGSNIPSVPLPNPIFHPPGFPLQTVHKHEMLSAAANILNGYRFPGTHLSAPHPAAPVRQEVSHRSTLGQGLKLNPRPSHLAPIHPW
ncbi:hypothetical protein CSKR_110415 [Clonorchis sinensis]|uniref:Uncharacterized protein n=1 Tax=Clonorchis sinensis TaxID=79923 RepID=A0A3R7H5L9_CLOSI|nr:hypothetical protein CSKR_110415 [Clonorchis sinensis]